MNALTDFIRVFLNIAILFTIFIFCILLVRFEAVARHDGLKTRVLGTRMVPPGMKRFRARAVVGSAKSGKKFPTFRWGGGQSGHKPAPPPESDTI